MKKRIVLLLVLCCLIQKAEAEEDEDSIVLNSSVAEYSGKKITLTGNVVVEHELGKISADRVELIPESEKKKSRFSSLKMNDHVLISLKDGGQLSCSLADLNYHSFTGTFSGNPEQEYVVYTENCHDRTGVGVPLVVKSQEMNVEIARKEGVSPKSSIKEIKAENHVTVNYNQDFVVMSDHAFYQRLPSVNEENIPGIISFCAEELSGLCQVTNRNGDLIRANQIYIDTIKRNLVFVEPRGALFGSTLSGNVNNRVDFSCEIMSWDESNDVLTLNKHVEIQQQGVGKLCNNGEMRIFRHVVGSRKQLKFIKSTGETTLTYSDANSFHTLTCLGNVVVDQENLVTMMESPLDAAGNVGEKQQICFQDHIGEIYADKVTLSYEHSGQDIVPQKMVLRGNVQILRRSSLGEGDPGKFLQYAVSDALEYFPQSKEMIFFGTNQRRVLFVDKANNIKMSAPVLKMKRDLKTEKDSIEGVGDVRFNFMEKEMEQLRKRFGFLEEPANEGKRE